MYTKYPHEFDYNTNDFFLGFILGVIGGLVLILVVLGVLYLV